MFKCTCCGYECDCMDLYYDHLMFDARHREMAQREAATKKATQPSKRLGAGSRRKSSSLLIRKQSSEPSLESKRPLLYSSTGY
ncbi:hypothetical protein COEREDRAFT_82262 [Coemansia reversa NRRL 1564]|uniref:Uncharacterized protein n=1 Tax=Coemansia reversa (strain ATCC 12441 / NRRL 1564) TaxID=763665 RepID=A0A2G5B7U2_COERN|nr:hypothetical protein COEREDRAFT_82262 [Coemansia reversa NRRL 1564]|eukprot:PIA15052.1 hypothetical protein COEREDRAFT_82262 [Coemansia reversa NRRL 1564]